MASIIGVILFFAGTAISIFTNQEEIQAILGFITFLIIGIILTNVKHGLILSFFLSLVLGFISNTIIQPIIMYDINILVAFLVLLLTDSIISAGLGAVGGYIGNRFFKTKEFF
jgi:hypothetical protein